MVTSQIKELAALRDKLAKLEREVEVRRRQELASLHRHYGYDDSASLIVAIQSSAGSGGKRGRKAANEAKSGVKTRQRAVITEAKRARVKKLVQAGKTGGQIAKAVGISLPSVQNIKKALGLVQARGGKKAAPAKKGPSKKASAPKRKGAAAKAPPSPASSAAAEAPKAE